MKSLWIGPSAHLIARCRRYPPKSSQPLAPRGQTCDRDALSSLGHDCPKGRSTYPV